MSEGKVGFAVLAEEWEDMWAGFSWSQLNPLAWTLQDALHPKNIKCAAPSGGPPFSGSMAHIADGNVRALGAVVCRPACVQLWLQSTRRMVRAGLGFVQGGAQVEVQCVR